MKNKFFLILTTTFLLLLSFGSFAFAAPDTNDAFAKENVITSNDLKGTKLVIKYSAEKNELNSYDQSSNFVIEDSILSSHSSDGNVRTELKPSRPGTYDGGAVNFEYKIQLSGANLRNLTGKRLGWVISHGSSTMVPDNGYLYVDKNGCLKMMSVEGDEELKTAYNIWSNVPYFDNKTSNPYKTEEWTITIAGLDDNTNLSGLNYKITQYANVNPQVITGANGTVQTNPISGTISNDTTVTFHSKLVKGLEPPVNKKETYEESQNDIKLSAEIKDYSGNKLPVNATIPFVIKPVDKYESCEFVEAENQSVDVQNGVGSTKAKFKFNKPGTYQFYVSLDSFGTEDQNYNIIYNKDSVGADKPKSTGNYSGTLILEIDEAGNSQNLYLKDSKFVSNQASDNLNGSYPYFTVTAYQTKPETIEPAQVTVKGNDNIVLKQGNTEHLETVVTPENAEDKSINWSSTDENVASVDPSGNIVAKNQGNCIITATAVNGVNDQVNVTVEQIVPEAETITSIDSPTTTIKQGESVNVSALVDGDAAQTLTWTSSDQKVATVKSNGGTEATVTAVAPGETTITASTEDGQSPANLLFTVEGKAEESEDSQNSETVKVNKLSLKATDTDLAVGEQLQLEANIDPKEAAEKALDWESSDNTVATVDETGLVTALKSGTTRISCTDQESGKRDSVYLHISDPIVTQETPESVSLNTTSATVTEGETFALKATVNKDDKVSWSSSDKTVASVDRNGTVTARKAGDAIITATAKDDPEAKADCTISVEKAQVDVKSLTLSQRTLKLAVGESKEVTATVTPNDATDNIVSWSSSDLNIVTVKGTDNTATIAAISEGEATITAKAGEFTKTINVTVNEADKETATPVEQTKRDKTTSDSDQDSELTLNKTSMNLTRGTSGTLKVKEDSKTDDVTWKSSAPSIASVSSTGKVSANRAGTAVITATDSETKTEASCSVTVEQQTTKVTSIKLNKRMLTLPVGKISTLKATVKPTDAKNQSITYYSSNENIVTVTSGGRITAKKRGIATITAISKDGNRRASCRVRVK